MDKDLELNDPLTVKSGIKIVGADPEFVDVKLYPKRWLMLVLFNLFAFCNTAQWAQYTIIGNVVSRYYDISMLSVEWTALLFSICSIIFGIPASYVMNKVGLRASCVIGIVGTTLGAWIKYTADPTRIHFIYIGQFLVALCQIPVATMPTRVSAYWFSAEQVGTATVIGCCGPAFGLAALLFFAPILVKNHENVADIGRDLNVYCLGIAVICSIVSAGIVFLFEDQPKVPPSYSRVLQKKRQNQAENSIEPIKRICKEPNFWILWNVYGIVVGILNTVTNLLNPLYLAHFENGEEDIGRIGLSYFLIGTSSGIFIGIIMDRTKAYKKILIVINILCLIGYILFAVTLHLEIKWAIYVSAIVMGTFLLHCFSVGYEFCAEITYPEPEESAAVILNTSNHFYTLILIPLINKLLEDYSETYVHIVISVLMLVAILMSFVIKNDYRRQATCLKKLNET